MTPWMPNSTVAPQAAAHFASLPPGSPPAYFPTSGFYDVPHTPAANSPAWVDPTTVEFDAGTGPDDVNGTIGRGRLPAHKVRYKVEKKEITEFYQDGYYTYTAVVPTEVISQGVVIDLYDWNFMIEGALDSNRSAAILQIGYGNGSYGTDRNRGVIYRSRIEFNKIYTSLP